MRKLRRAIARAKMKAEGIQHINKKVPVYVGKEFIGNISYFAQHWREY